MAHRRLFWVGVLGGTSNAFTGFFTGTIEHTWWSAVFISAPLTMALVYWLNDRDGKHAFNLFYTPRWKYEVVNDYPLQDRIEKYCEENKVKCKVDPIMVRVDHHPAAIQRQGSVYGFLHQEDLIKCRLTA